MRSATPLALLLLACAGERSAGQPPFDREALIEASVDCGVVAHGPSPACATDDDGLGCFATAWSGCEPARLVLTQTFDDTARSIEMFVVAAADACEVVLFFERDLADAASAAAPGGATEEVISRCPDLDLAASQDDGCPTIEASGCDVVWTDSSPAP